MPLDCASSLACSRRASRAGSTGLASRSGAGRRLPARGGVARLSLPGLTVRRLIGLVARVRSSFGVEGPRACCSSVDGFLASRGGFVPSSLAFLGRRSVLRLVPALRRIGPEERDSLTVKLQRLEKARRQGECLWKLRVHGCLSTGVVLINTTTLRIRAQLCHHPGCSCVFCGFDGLRLRQ